MSFVIVARCENCTDGDRSVLINPKPKEVCPYCFKTLTQRRWGDGVSVRMLGEHLDVSGPLPFGGSRG